MMLLKFSGLLILAVIVLVLFSAAMLYAALLFFCWAIEALTKHDARKRASAFKDGVFLLLVVAMLSGCAGTVTPKVVASQQASWDGDAQNSGIIAETDDHHGVVTPHFRDRYNVMIETFGVRFQPPLRKDDGIQPTGTNTFLIDAQHLADFMKMNRWRKAPQ